MNEIKFEDKNSDSVKKYQKIWTVKVVSPYLNII